MRPEQIEKLISIEEELVDVFTGECKPEAWPGMADTQSRGDRYWHKKNALATLTLVGRIQTVLRDARGDGAGAKDGDTDPRPDGVLEEESIEKEAKRLEAQGVAILKKHAKRGR